MNSELEHNQPTQADTSWFDEAPNSSPSPRPRRSWKRPLIFAGLALLVLGGTTTAVLIAISPSSTCLTRSDYYDLTGIQHADNLTTTSRFYTGFATFNDNTTRYDSTASGTSTTMSMIEKLAAFYKTHAGRSMIFTVDASYQNDADITLVESRIDTVAADLIKAGIPSEIVTQGIPYLNVPEEPDAVTTVDNAVTISLTSSESCQ